MVAFLVVKSEAPLYLSLKGITTVCLLQSPGLESKPASPLTTATKRRN